MQKTEHGVNGATEDAQAAIERLRGEHAELERRLFELDRRAYLTPDEHVERVTIKKLKLQKKDQMLLMQVRAGVN